MANIVITGCSRGIGYYVVQRLCSSNHKVIGISRSGEKLKELTSYLPNNLFEGIVFDLNNITNECNKLQEIISSHFSIVDILINNAGILINKSLISIEEDDIQSMFSTNTLAPFFLSKIILPLMENSGYKHIVNIGSMGGVQGSSKYEGLGWYSATKSTMATLTECMAKEWKIFNVKINYLALGAVNTEMLEEAFPGYKAPVDADEMADFIVEFALNGHRYFNGKIIPVSISNP